MWARSIGAVIAFTLGLAACDQGGAQFPSCALGNAGIVLLSWTVRGAPPTVASCGGIDHLELDLNPASCEGASIEPIPCALDKFRYDGLPQGAAELTLFAVDTAGNMTISGSARVDLEPPVPPAPTPIDLR